MRHASLRRIVFTGLAAGAHQIDVVAQPQIAPTAATGVPPAGAAPSGPPRLSPAA